MAQETRSYFAHNGSNGLILDTSNDLKLLTPSMKVLNILATICEQYADKFAVLFNGKKSLLLIYKCTRSHPLILVLL